MKKSSTIGKGAPDRGLRNSLPLTKIAGAMTPAQPTRHTLLQRACNVSDESAWNEFVQHYRRFILYILRHLGVAADDVEDLTQEILIALTRDLPRYERSRAGFRTWLGTVIRNSAFVHFRKSNCHHKYLRIFENEQATDLAGRIPDITRVIEDEWSTYVASLAMTRVREVFQGNAIEVFELTLDGHSAAAVAERTGLTVASVYTLNKRVKKRLYLEIRALSSELEP